MPRGKRVVGLGIGSVVVAVLLAGCASPAPTATSSAPSPAATPTPAFTSDADAVAAAKAFYLKYLKVANSIAMSTDEPASGLRRYLSADQYASESADITSLRDHGEYFSGPGTLKVFKKQEASAVQGSLTAYVCIDTTKARLINSKGHDVTPTGRGKGVTLVVNFSGLPSASQIVSSDKWSGQSVC